MPVPDIRQSKKYAEFTKSLGWQVEKLGKWHVFIKKFPIVGSLIKIQRVEPPIPYGKIEKLAKKHRALQIIIEPSLPPSSPVQPEPQSTTCPQRYRPLRSPFIPTKTLVLDLKPSEQEIFNSFSKNKRRDIRLAQKNDLVIEEGSPQDFYELKKKSFLRRHLLPIGTKNEIFPLCQAFGQNAKILIAHLPNTSNLRNKSHRFSNNLLAGLLLLFSNKTAYYWQAASTKKGNKLLAPTILLWEAIKLAKKKGCTKFDFEGIFDDRFPQNRSWLGFTHFKKGFGGKEVTYPLPLSFSKFPFNFF